MVHIHLISYSFHHETRSLSAFSMSQLSQKENPIWIKISSYPHIKVVKISCMVYLSSYFTSESGSPNHNNVYVWRMYSKVLWRERKKTFFFLLEIVKLCMQSISNPQLYILIFQIETETFNLQNGQCKQYMQQLKFPNNSTVFFFPRHHGRHSKFKTILLSSSPFSCFDKSG